MRLFCPRRGFKFTLVSYNILSQTLLKQHKELYRFCNPKYLAWPYRGVRILSRLIATRADIICLQEVDSDHLEDLLRPSLRTLGYECIYKKKTGYKVDGCAIFYRRSLFNLDSYKGVEFNRQDINEILNRDQVGLIAVFNPIGRDDSDGDNKLIVANTHLLFNPMRIDIKLAQIQLFLSEIHQIAVNSHPESKQYQHFPTILCGDMNSPPDSKLNKFLLKNLNLRTYDDSNHDINNYDEQSDKESDNKNLEKNYNRPSSITNNCDSTNPFDFNSVYPCSQYNDLQLVSSLSNCVVDYIYYTPGLKVKKKQSLPTLEAFIKLGPIPNKNNPSDHLLLASQFEMI